MKIFPLVSVIIPTYKRSDMLPRAIDSVLSQTYKNVEVVVVDDNDPDTEFRKTTAEMIRRKYADDSRVKYILHDKSRNGSAARNTGIKQALGEIVAFLDDDDIYLPKKIEMQVDYLLEKKQFGAVYCGWDRNGIVIPAEEGDLSYNILSGDHIIYTDVILMWREIAIKCGGWDESFKRHQEAAFLLNFFKYGGEIGVVKKSLVLFDVSDRSNAAKDPKVNEEQLDHYLITYKDLINSFEKRTKKKIYIHRYRGAFLCYIKSKKIFAALFFFVRKCYRFPISFIMDVLRYSLKKKKKSL